MSCCRVNSIFLFNPSAWLSNWVCGWIGKSGYLEFSSCLHEPEFEEDWGSWEDRTGSLSFRNLLGEIRIKSGWLKNAGWRRWIVRTGSQFLTHQLSNSDSPKASAGCTCHFTDMHQTWKTQSRPGLSLRLPLPRNTHSSPTLPTQAVILSCRKEGRWPCLAVRALYELA